MSLDYSLKLEANIQPSTLLSLVSKISGIPYVNNTTLQDQLSHLTISAHLENDEFGIKVAEDEHGFRPFSYLSMHHGKKEFERNEELMLTIASGLLKKLDGNMVFEYQSEDPILKIINGKITFNSKRSTMYGIESLKDAGQSYDIAHLAYD